MPLQGWGRTSSVPARALHSEDLEAITAGAVLTRGLGRSYGDASLPARPGQRVACSRLANRILAWDRESGVLRAEAGLALVDLMPLVLARGWTLPVLPGTQFVTLGGMVAADVHGKNHHRAGSFGRHLRSLRMRLADGDRVECGPEREPELFAATLGGMGLTGHILEVELQLERAASPWVWQRIEHADDLETLVRRLVDTGREWPYTVAWADCLASGGRLGRGVVIAGRWAEPGEAPARPPAPRRRLRVPLTPPGGLANQFSGRLLNALYRASRRESERIVHPGGFFFPLDVIGDWNRLYGPRGFTQYQCVIPADAAATQLAPLLEGMRARGTPMLCVIMDFAAEGSGLLSFPRPGITVSVDLPFRRDVTSALVDELNERVIRAGGRVYLAKDALTRAEHFRAMEPRLAHWQTLRSKFDPAGRLGSALSRRLFGDEP